MLGAFLITRSEPGPTRTNRHTYPKLFPVPRAEGARARACVLCAEVCMGFEVQHWMVHASVLRSVTHSIARNLRSFKPTQRLEIADPASGLAQPYHYSAGST